MVDEYRIYVILSYLEFMTRINNQDQCRSLSHSLFMSSGEYFSGLNFNLRS